jgi:hypothetical protein
MRNHITIALAACLLLAGCEPEKDNGAAAALAEVERIKQEKEQAEIRLHEQEDTTSRWQVVAMLALGAMGAALIAGTILGSGARHDAGK